MFFLQRDVAGAVSSCQVSLRHINTKASKSRQSIMRKKAHLMKACKHAN